MPFFLDCILGSADGTCVHRFSRVGQPGPTLAGCFQQPASVGILSDSADVEAPEASNRTPAGRFRAHAQTKADCAHEGRTRRHGAGGPDAGADRRSLNRFYQAFHDVTMFR